jgi:hypothetical protein
VRKKSTRLPRPANRFLEKGIALDPADARTLASKGRNFFRRNHRHALICSRDCAAGHRGVSSRAGRRFDPVPAPDARRFRRDSHANGQAEDHTGRDRETVSERDDQTARQRDTGADRERYPFACAQRTRNPHSGPGTVRQSDADYRRVAHPDAARRPNGDFGRHFQRETSDQLPDSKAILDFPREADGYLDHAPWGNLDAATDPDSFHHCCAQTIRNRHAETDTDPDRDCQSFANSDAKAEPVAKTNSDSNAVTKTKSDSDAKTDSHSKAIADADADAEA